MKKLLLSLLLIFVFTKNYSQNQFAFGFEGTTAAMYASGWVQTNQSTPVGTATYSIPTAAVTAFSTGAQSGAALSYALINYNSTGDNGEISNWLHTPEINLENGDVISFYTRTVTPNPNPTPQNTYPDRLELRLSTNGGFTTLPSGGHTDLGDFTTLCLSVNPNLLLTGAGSYPGVWTQFSYTVSGLSAPTACLLAFRYWVEDGGFLGTNSNIIAIDTFSVDRPLANTQDFFSSNFSIYPNPAKSIINLNSKNGVTINSVEITDLNGRIVKQVSPSNVSETQINVSDLNAGVYFVKAQTENGVGTTKIVKQ